MVRPQRPVAVGRSSDPARGSRWPVEWGWMGLVRDEHRPSAPTRWRESPRRGGRWPGPGRVARFGRDTIRAVSDYCCRSASDWNRGLCSQFFLRNNGGLLRHGCDSPHQHPRRPNHTADRSLDPVDGGFWNHVKSVLIAALIPAIKTGRTESLQLLQAGRMAM